MSKPFEKPNRNEWLKDVQKYLKDGATIDNLKVKKGEVSLEPFYTVEEGINGRSLNLNSQAVKNIKIISSYSSSINAELLDDLEQGTEAVAIINIPYDKVQEILKDVNLEYISLVIVQEDPQEYNQYYDAYKSIDTVFLHKRYYSIAGGNDVACQVRELIKNTQEAFVHYTPTVDFYRSIAELRAIKSLLDQFSFQYQLVAVIELEGINDIGDFNLIEATYKVMSCYMGSCDYISIMSDHPEEKRLSQNIVNILKHESGFGNVMDPVSGSYFIEEYTNQIVGQF